MNTRLIGALGEQEAARFLRRDGYTIASANYRTHCGEIDIIARKDGYICFIEVKTRSEGGMYAPADAVGAGKQRNITESSKIYMSIHETGLVPRYDIIEVLLRDSKPVSVNHIKGAY